MIGNGDCRIDTNGGAIRLYTTPDGGSDRGIRINNNSGRLEVRQNDLTFTNVDNGTYKTVAWSDHTHSNYASSSHTHSNYASSSHTHSNYVPTSGSSFFESGSHDPYYSDKYNLGWSTKRWQQLASKYVYATNTYSLAIDNPCATISDDTLDGVLDNVIIESPNVMRMNDENGMNDKLVFNVNALKQSPNAHLFVGEDDGGNIVINESSMLALCILELQKVNSSKKELENKCADLEDRLAKIEKLIGGM